MNHDNHKIKHVELPQPNKLVVIEPLDYPNPYDFKKLHRHDYFEILLIKDGNGSQLVDFTSYPMNAGEVFVIYPGQVHLMNRNNAKGLVIQFRKDIFEYIHPVRHYNLYVDSASIPCTNGDFNHLYDIAERINELISNDNVLSAITKHKAYSYLQIILLTLVELGTGKHTRGNEHNIIEEYLSLITTHIHTHKKVSEYSLLLGCSPDKLNELCKAALGKTALELIHEELILEIRRLLLLNDMSLKEIAFELNFDSQANFSGFIKTRTGLTPKELQASVLEIYN